MNRSNYVLKQMFCGILQKVMGMQCLPQPSQLYFQKKSRNSTHLKKTFNL